MATYTAGDQINRALRLLGVLAESEQPSASESADALTALNQMIDSWNTERLSVFSTMDQTFTWPAGQATQTIGPTGTLVGLCPITLDDSTYFKNSAGVSFPIELINQEQYDAIPVKTITATYPQVLFLNQSFPNATLTLYPVPTDTLEFHFVSVDPLTQPVNLTDVLVFPPGYLRAFVYNLAMEIAPEFGIEPSHQVSRIAVASKRDLKRINNPDDLMSLPAGVVMGNPRFNIFAGQ